MAFFGPPAGDGGLFGGPPAGDGGLFGGRPAGDGSLFGGPPAPSGGFGRPANVPRGGESGLLFGGTRPRENFFGAAAMTNNNAHGLVQPRPPSLDWRGDPNTTFSDWTIELVVAENGGSVVFNVHRHSLVYGQNQSAYFANLFGAGGRFNESVDRTSRIELDKLQAEAFPKLLDHLYGLEGFSISTDVAVALHNLAEYFGVPTLQAETQNFMNSDFSRDTIGSYYRQAKALQNDTIMEAVQTFLVDHIDWAPTSDLMEINDLEFWLGVLTKVSEKWNGHHLAKDVSRNVSRLVATYCAKHRDELDAEAFLMLTNESIMPVIAFECALLLCSLDDEFAPAAEGDEEPTPLGDLQIRCAHVLAANMSKLAEGNSDDMEMMLSERNPEFLAMVIMERSRFDNHGFGSSLGIFHSHREPAPAGFGETNSGAFSFGASGFGSP